MACRLTLPRRCSRQHPRLGAVEPELESDGTVRMEPGCNTGGGRYVVEGDTVEISAIHLTRMFCEGDRGELENALPKVLQSGPLTVQVVAKPLTLTGDGVGLGLRAASN